MGYFTLKGICEVQNDDNMLCPTPSVEWPEAFKRNSSFSGWPEAYKRNSSFPGSSLSRQERDTDNVKVSD